MWQIWNDVILSLDTSNLILGIFLRIYRHQPVGRLWKKQSDKYEDGFLKTSELYFT